VSATTARTSGHSDQTKFSSLKGSLAEPEEPRLGKFGYAPESVEHSGIKCGNYPEGKGHFTCKKHGAFIERVFWLESQNRWIGRDCPTCVAEDKREHERAHAMIQLAKNSPDQKALDAVRSVGAPPYLREVSLKQYKAVNEKAGEVLKQCQAYVEDFPKALKKCTNLIMCGNTGTGKTMLAYAIAHGIAYRYQHIARVTKVYDMLRAIKSTWGSKESDEREAYAMFRNPPLLIIDEIGVQFGSDAEKEIFFQIINDRYEHMCPTALISNLTPKELKAFLGDRVMDRMRSSGGKVLIFDWESYR
jgi:DNA replication protein DnaC